MHEIGFPGYVIFLLTTCAPLLLRFVGILGIFGSYFNHLGCSER